MILANLAKRMQDTSDQNTEQNNNGDIGIIFVTYVSSINY